MKCKDSKKLLLLYLDGQISVSRRDEIERHLETCNACRLLLAEMQDVLSAPPPEMPVPAGFLFQVRARLHANSHPQPVRWRRVLEPLAKPVFAFLLFTSSAFFGLWLSDTKVAVTDESTTQLTLERAYKLDQMDTESETTLVGAYLAVMEN